MLKISLRITISKEAFRAIALLILLQFFYLI